MTAMVASRLFWRVRVCTMDYVLSKRLLSELTDVLHERSRGGKLSLLAAAGGLKRCAARWYHMWACHRWRVSEYFGEFDAQDDAWAKWWSIDSIGKTTNWSSSDVKLDVNVTSTAFDQFCVCLAMLLNFWWVDLVCITLNLLVYCIVMSLRALVLYQQLSFVVYIYLHVCTCVHFCTSFHCNGGGKAHMSTSRF